MKKQKKSYQDKNIIGNALSEQEAEKLLVQCPIEVVTIIERAKKKYSFTREQLKQIEHIRKNNYRK